jgi:demethylmenaquinone methyltransferase / 2-methoxy-6-polyprenyl-1,4-benzoquinol methylase
MHPIPSRQDTDAAVHLPHSPIPGYYANGDLAAREHFLRTTFDDTAVDYNRIERLLGLGTGSRYRRMALERAGLKPGMQVVDLGMGTGLVSQEILNITHEPKCLIGVDPSPGMMAQAKLPPEVECRLGRAEEIPVPDASVDFLVMGYALRHIADFSVACAEFRRVLKPGGRLLILEITRPKGRVATALLKAYMHGAAPLLARIVSKAPATPLLWRYYWDTIATCITPPQVLGALTAAGLRDAKQYVELGIFSEYTARG